MNHNQILKQYCRQVSRKIPIGGRQKRAFLNNLEQNVSAFLCKNPGADSAGISDCFGEPEDIALSFLSEMSYEEISAKFRKGKTVLFITVLTAIVTIFLLCATLWRIILENRNLADGYYSQDFSDVSEYDNTQSNFSALDYK